MSHIAEVKTPKNLKKITCISNKIESFVLEELVNKNAISRMQCDTVYKAISSMNTKRSFLLADGTGVGKGRVLAATALDFVMRNKGGIVVWFSINSKLKSLTRRDINSMGPIRKVFKWINTENNNTGNLFYMSYPRMRCENTMRKLVDCLKGRHVLFILDECHFLRRKNQAAHRMSNLLRSFAQSHVLFSSATPASSHSHIHYLQRLFSSEEVQCIDRISKSSSARGLEIAAMQLVRNGNMLCRQLCDRNITSEIVNVPVSGASAKLYDACVKAIHSSTNFSVKSRYQSFFRNLLSSFKVPVLISRIKEELSNGKSVIVTVQSTGGALAKRQEKSLRTFRSMCDEFMQTLGHSFIFEHDVIDSLIKEFGEVNISDLSGRCSRQSKVTARERFQNGETNIAILSKSASTGVSLHSEHQYSRQRVHMLVELPWTSEGYLQQCGRSHRAMSYSVPHYVIFKTCIPAERRFFVSLQQRLKNVSAMCTADRHSDHDAGKFLNGDLTSINTKTKRMALVQLVYEYMMEKSPQSVSVPLKRFHTKSPALFASSFIINSIKKDSLSDALVSDHDASMFLQICDQLFPQTKIWKSTWNKNFYTHLSPLFKKTALTIACLASREGTYFHRLPQCVVETIIEKCIGHTAKESVRLLQYMKNTDMCPSDLVTMSVEKLFNRMLMMPVEMQSVLEHLLLSNSDVDESEFAVDFDTYLKTGIEAKVDFRMKRRNMNGTILEIDVELNSISIPGQFIDGDFYMLDNTMVLRRQIEDTVSLSRAFSTQRVQLVSLLEESSWLEHGKLIKASDAEICRVSRNWKRRETRKANKACTTYRFVTDDFIRSYETSMRRMVSSSDPKWGTPFFGLVLPSIDV